MKQILITATLILFTIAAIGQNLIWDTLNTGTTKNINDIYFQSPDTGYIVGDDYLFKKTTDGGLTWIDLTAPTIGEKPGNKGKIVGIDYYISFNMPIAPDSALHLRWEKPYHGLLTQDEGASYSTYPFGYSFNNDSNLFCSTSGFSILPSSIVGYTQLITYGQNCSGDAVYSSYNDGPFFTIDVDTSTSFSFGTFTDVDADSIVTIFAHSNGYLLRRNTAIGPDSIFLDSSGVSAIVYAGNHVWYAATNRDLYNMYISLDSGKTFKPDSTFQPTFLYPKFNDFDFLTNGSGITGGTSNGSFGSITIRNFNQWYSYPASEPINAVKIFDNGTAYAAGDSGLVMKTVITTSINEVGKAGSKLTVYPNPTHDHLQLYGLGSRNVDKIQLFDLNGKLIQDFPNPGRKLSLTNYQKGMYILRIHAEGKQFSRKVIVR